MYGIDDDGGDDNEVLSNNEKYVIKDFHIVSLFMLLLQLSDCDFSKRHLRFGIMILQTNVSL